MISKITLALVIALGASIQVQAQTHSTAPVEPADQTPAYRVSVVSRTTRAVNYGHHSDSTKINFQGTDLMPGAKGEAVVQSKRGATKIVVEFDGLDKPTTFGNEYLTYVMWAISPEGRPVNLGEVLRGGNHRSKLDVTTDLQAFALIVTAEPYYAVHRPSNLVVLENAIRSDTVGTTEAVDAKYELIDRGGYIPTGFKFDPVVLNAKLPLEFFEARNAVRIAQSAGAEKYATTSYEKAVRQMKEADELATRKHQDKKSLISVSREAVQTAEDAREISVKRIDADRAEAERSAGAGREADAVRQRNEADRKNLDAQAAAQQAAYAQANAEKARNDAQQQQQAAQADSARNRAAAASSDAQLQQALRDREELRARLLQQFNLILETRDTARGLVVNMSDVLFDSGKFTLRPLAREKLAKISGIVLAYPSLKLAIEGNTDSVGTELFNQQLSEQRAEAVRSYLTQQGVPESSTTATGFGKTRPIASNDTSEGRQQNRRVELIVSGEVIGTKIVSLSLQPVAAVTSPR